MIGDERDWYTITIPRVIDGQWCSATKDHQHQKKQKLKLQESAGKIMLTAFGDVKGIVHLKFIPKGTTNNFKETKGTGLEGSS